MNRSEVKAIVDRFDTRHPHWEIVTRDNELDERLLHIEFVYVGPDSTQDRISRVQHLKLIDCDLAGEANEITRMVKHEWVQAWVHEAKEWLLFDGAVYDDPHKYDRS